MLFSDETSFFRLLI